MPYYERGLIRVSVLRFAASINSPTVAELNAGIDVTAALVNPEGFSPSISTTTVDRTLWRSRQIVEMPVRWQANMTLKAYREIVDASDALWRSMNPFGARRVFVVRRGLPQATAWASGQRLETHDARVGKRAMLPPGGGPAVFTVPLYGVTSNDDAVVN